MKTREIKNTYLLLASLFALLAVSCVEQFEAETLEFQSLLVVDARLTDKVGQQTIYLSRTFEFESEAPSPEQNAAVTVLSESGVVFRFEEEESGAYTSVSSLQLSHEDRYQLQIITSNGATYTSDFERLPQPLPIEDVKAIRRTNNTGLDGVAIVLNTAAASGQPQFFRYEYEETYKIIAPEYNPFEWDQIDYDINDGDGWEVTLQAREEEARICYASNASNNLILASSEGSSFSGIKDFEVRFLSRENYFIAHRYSILVKQFHHSVNANSFFKSLQDFSSFDDVFSNVQPGLLEGNIRSNSKEDLVLGFFELSTYTEKRFFFNYEDHFPGEPLPPYIINCSVGAPPLYPDGFHFTPAGDGSFVIDGNGNSPLIEGILAGLYDYHSDNPGYEDWLATEGLSGAAPYLVLPSGCGDCRRFGSVVPPDFWEE
ncbi:MAG: DUF4249 domain-containing protein [Bacteroidota bacterium]